MSRSARSSAGRGDSNSRKSARAGRNKRSFNDSDERQGDGEGNGRLITGKHIPLTKKPSMQNILAQFYNPLPPVVRNALPFGTEARQSDSGDDKEAPKDKRGEASWQDVCFIHSIPGDDEEEGVVVLNDGSFRKYVSVKGVNVLLYDDADRDQMARQFANFVNACDTDIQIIIKSRHLSVDEYLEQYQVHIKSDNAYLKWYADYTDKWFRRVQDVSFVPQREFYVVVSYQPPDCKSGQIWSGRRSIQRHEEYLAQLNRQVKTAFEQLRATNLRPKILTRKEVRNLI
ncbi:MAG: hypothetical protein K8F91_24520, partial [Candidatus Obscuribacterales bacterium]|nr:hypothetical protein [Candidatus Obscuribacterales bacterium]